MTSRQRRLLCNANIDRAHVQSLFIARHGWLHLRKIMAHVITLLMFLYVACLLLVNVYSLCVINKGDLYYVHCFALKQYINLVNNE